MNVPLQKRQIGCSIPVAVYAGIAAMGKAIGIEATPMAERLLMAAYTARCKSTGDGALDAAAAAIDGKITDADRLVEKLQAEVAQRDAQIAELNAEMAKKVVNDHAEDLTTLRHMIAERNRRIEGLTDKLKKADDFWRTMEGKLKRATDAATELEKDFNAKLAEAAARIAELEKAPQRAPAPAVIVEAIPSPADELLMWLFAIVDTVDLADLVGKPESTITNMRSEWRSARAKRRAAA